MYPSIEAHGLTPRRPCLHHAAAHLVLVTAAILPGCFQVPSTLDIETNDSSGTEGASTTQVSSAGATDLTTTMTSPDGDGLTDPFVTTSIDDDGAGTDTGETEPPVTCGNGVLDPGEQCDDGNANGPRATCRENCTNNVCGDGDLSPLEGCDDGNLLAGDGCNASCQSESCGNGIVDGTEDCDDGADGDQDDGCTDACRLPACGDGFQQLNEGELCDDGNGSNLDACVEGCVPATCGDGYAWMGQEACDDGDVDNTDACLVTCQAASCGDGYVRVGFEECDDEGNANGDGCSSTCQEEAGWDCDAAGCDTVCGDGVVAGDECCDDGNAVSGDLCPANCALTERRVFVSSVFHDGDFNGLAEANVLCQFLAENAGLTGSYRAWLSTSTSSPATDWVPSAACNVPYSRVDGVTIAITWADLTDGSLMAPISVDENGIDVCSYGGQVWTGTTSDGSAADMYTCSDWNSAYSDYGRYGYCYYTSDYWTSASDQHCINSFRIYCFEH